MASVIETLPQWIGWGIHVEVGGVFLEGEWTRPAGAQGMVVMVPEGAEPLTSPRSRRLAGFLHEAG